MKYLVGLLLVITFAFPKAGLKLGGFPLYLSLLSMFAFQLWGAACVLKSRANLLVCGAIIGSILLFFAMSASSFAHASLPSAQISAYLAALSTFIVYFGAVRMESVLMIGRQVIGVCFWFLVLYAFLQKTFGDYAVVVPGLTANYQEAVTPGFLADKNNMIWGLGYLKATSTYQNGNLFGVNLLLIGFAYIAILRERGARFILPLGVMGLACLLTASASVFIGFAVGCMHLLVSFKAGARSAVFVSIAALAIGFPLFAYIAFGDNLLATILQERLLNRDLTEGGGRVVKVVAYLEALGRDPGLLFTGMLFYSRPFSEIYEITYLSMLQMFGIVVTTVYLAFVGFRTFALRRTIYLTPVLAYLGAGLSDGASWLPPTMTNFFLVLGICTAWMMKSRALAIHRHGRIVGCALPRVGARSLSSPVVN